jgi:hypothetical protein
MTYPASPPRRYTTSKQLIGGDDFNNLNDHLNSFQALTALGVAQADAAQINAANVEILVGSAANTGVKLPVSYPGASIIILNNSANTENIYPLGNDQIQNGATGFAAAAAAVTMATGVSASFMCIKKGFWQVDKTTGP